MGTVTEARGSWSGVPPHYDRLLTLQAGEQGDKLRVMPFRPLLLFLSIASLSLAQLRWRTPGACLAPTGTLCRTVVYEASGWENRGWGLYAFDRYTGRITEAVRSDGAALLRIARRSFKFYVIPVESYDRTRLIFPSQERTVEIERSRNELRDLGGVWSFNELWSDERTDDADCSKRAARAGEGAKKTRIELLGGVSGVEYVYATTDNHIVQRIAFAPSLGCTAIYYRLLRRSSTGLPLSEDTLTLRSAALAEPDQHLFVIPDGYNAMPEGKPWPHVWMDKFPGDISGTGFSRVAPSSHQAAPIRR
jgi:hypothetical protein